MKSLIIALSLVAALSATNVAEGRAEHTYRTVPPAPRADADPADSLYRAARRALNLKEYESAARIFDQIVAQYPRSEYAPDALYWKGFSLNRAGKLDDAVDALEAQAKRSPNA